VVSDMAKGVGEAVHKVADMGREAAGRGLETAKGLYTGGKGEGGIRGRGGGARWCERGVWGEEQGGRS